MTVKAHGTQRSHGHASRTRDMENSPAPRTSLYRELHPEMFTAQRNTLRGRRLSDDERKAAIVENLRMYGPATAVQIAYRMGVNIKKVSPYLTAGIDGVIVVGRVRNQIGRGDCKRIWGLKHGISQ